ncbi:MAG: hypothetical protein DRN10_01445 [Thermoplasmata archaeon]|nr:MAG: hypothetical protein DRN10_01445 [Thermoplasmata archaeon]
MIFTETAPEFPKSRIQPGKNTITRIENASNFSPAITDTIVPQYLLLSPDKNAGAGIFGHACNTSHAFEPGQQAFSLPSVRALHRAEG